MQPIKCPTCGAPAQVAPGATGASAHTCQFCKTPFQLAPASRSDDERPQSVEIHLHMSHDHGGGATTAAAEAGRTVGRALTPLLMVGGIVALTSLAGGGYALSGGLLGAHGWDGKKPFACSGNERVHAQGVTATFTAGSAITIEDNCHFECEDCTVKAPIVATVRTNGEAVFVNGSIEGTDTVAEVVGNGQFDLRGNAHATGGKPRVKNNGKVSGIPSSMTAPSAAPAAAAPAPSPALPTTGTTKTTTKPSAKH